MTFDQVAILLTSLSILAVLAYTWSRPRLPY